MRRRLEVACRVAICKRGRWEGVASEPEVRFHTGTPPKHVPGLPSYRPSSGLPTEPVALILVLLRSRTRDALCCVLSRMNRVLLYTACYARESAGCLRYSGSDSAYVLEP